MSTHWFPFSKVLIKAYSSPTCGSSVVHSLLDNPDSEDSDDSDDSEEANPSSESLGSLVYSSSERSDSWLDLAL